MLRIRGKSINHDSLCPNNNNSFRPKIKLVIIRKVSLLDAFVNLF